ncbi:NDP-glycosyltransferase YjiC-like [Oppia nitens]|uniref:NDP-glycosyltransferase YjiC-like n=1 Tax=Oppia nitens TaxID=1686743 RepID=UPI0023DC07DB|nr:NDP-glycosyltransferase YjiC-like [Oppia nitens]
MTSINDNNNNNSKKQLTILVAPGSFVGPIMSSIGIAEVLRDSGHRVVYAVKADWRDKLVKLNFEVELIGGGGGEQEEKDSVESNVELAQLLMGNESLLDKEIKTVDCYTGWIPELEANEPYFQDIIDRLKPDCIVCECVTLQPTIINSRCVKVYYHSNNALSMDMLIDDPRLPPARLGLSLNSDKQLWKEYRKQLNQAKQKSLNEWHSWLQSKGCPPMNETQILYPSPYANLYLAPKELDYTDIRPLPDNYYQFDYFKRTADDDDVFELPEKFRQKSGKLVYLSLGSMGSSDVDLMKRLVGMLAKSEHRFIVSKGVNHDKYELADNMWGERFVSQVKVLPIVDLFITHGGNNSITESMYFGKPMIVCPIFMDQFDNAQIVDDRGYGIRLNPYECSEQQLLQSIDKLLNDTKLAEKLAKASKRIQTDKQIEKISEIIENLVKMT